MDERTASRVKNLINRLRTVEDKARQDKPLYSGPWFPKPAHVIAYFGTFDSVVEEATTLGVLDQDQVARLKNLRGRLGVHRDDVASLLALSAELGSLLDSALHPFHEELDHLRKQNTEMRERLAKCESEMANIKRIGERR